jgi:DinB superfamily
LHWPGLTFAIEEFQVIRGRTLDIAAALSEQQARKRSGTQTWSVAEVLDHLLRTELAFRKYQREALERARSGLKGTIRVGFREVDTRLRPLPRSWMPVLAPILTGLHTVTPFRFRLAVMRTRGLVWAAAPKVAEPRSARALDELRTDLGAEMRQTAALFEGDLPEILPRVRVAHPLYGSNSVLQMMRLMGAHEERHQHQLRTILKKP